jgi:hypothetical protein
MRPEMHIVWVMCGMVGSDIILAQEAAPVAQAPPTVLAQPPELPPLPKSPIASFRSLLTLSPEALDTELADKSEGQRKLLRAKLQEYQALDPEQREARLKATELRWYLRPLLEMAPTNRVRQVAMVPDEFRTLIEARLRQWDLLTSDMRRDLLENERIIDYFWQAESSPPSTRVVIPRQISSARRAELENGLVRWRAIPLEKREQMCNRFRQFFELSPSEKARTLSALSEQERKQMEETLKAFENLPPAQRRLCIGSFRRFANMSPEDRTRFLKNAERWKEMSAAERQTWRILVAELPPAPPGYGQPLPPPIPPQRNPAAGPNLTNVGH